MQAQGKPQNVELYFKLLFKCQFAKLELILKQVHLMVVFETHGNSQTYDAYVIS